MHIQHYPDRAQKGQHPAPAVADKGQGYAGYGDKTDTHSDILDRVQQEHRADARR